MITGWCALSKTGYWYVGDVWFQTPEEALLQEADNDAESKRILSIKKLIKQTNIDDITVMTFVSKNDTLVDVTLVKNKKGLYSVYGYTEEVYLSSPSEFIATGDTDQFILFPYSTYNNTVYGWCYSDIVPLVNDMIPLVETYEFECQGKKWTLNYWWISDIRDIDNVEVCFNVK